MRLILALILTCTLCNAGARLSTHSVKNARSGMAKLGKYKPTKVTKAKKQKGYKPQAHNQVQLERLLRAYYLAGGKVL